jgi:hypothetical protein
MFEFIKTLIDFLTDKSKSIGHKTAILLSSVALLFVIDILFSFTYDIHISNKLANLQTIHALKEVYKNDSIELKKLDDTELRLLNSRHYTEWLPFLNYSKGVCRTVKTVQVSKIQSIKNDTIILSKDDSIKIWKFIKIHKDSDTFNDVFKYIHFYDSISKSQRKLIQKTEVRTITQQEGKINSNEPSKIWLFVSANYIFVLLFVILFGYAFFNKQQSRKDSIIGAIAIQFILLIIMLCAYWSSLLIPVINNNPLWNYLINSIIHLIIIIIVTKLIIRGSKK